MVGKAAEKITTDLLLPPLDLAKGNLVNQCQHNFNNIAGHMNMANKRYIIATLKLLKKMIRPQCTTGWWGETMNTLNDSVGPY